MSVARANQAININYTQIYPRSLLDHDDDYSIETAVKTNGNAQYLMPLVTLREREGGGLKRKREA